MKTTQVPPPLLLSRIGQALAQEAGTVRTLVAVLRNGSCQGEVQQLPHLGLLLAAWNCLTIGAYSILSPIKKGLLLYNEPYMIPLSYIVAPVLTGVAALIYSRCVHLPRGRLIQRGIILLSCGLLVWAGVLAWGQALPLLHNHWGWVEFGYSLWVDMHNMLAVTTLWLYANDILEPEHKKLLFGRILMGASLGALLLAPLPGFLIERIGTIPLLVVAACVYALSWFLVAACERLIGPGQRPLKGVEDPPSVPWTEMALVRQSIFSSKFLTFLAILVALERFLPGIMEWIFGIQWKLDHPTLGRENYTAVMAQFFWLQHTAGILVSVLLVPYLARSFAMGSLLVASSLLVFAGFIAFAAVPVFPIILCFNWAEGLQRYTWFKDAKERMYSLMHRDLLYRVKPTIDMFFYRLGKSLAGILILFVTSGFFGFGIAPDLKLGPWVLSCVGIAAAVVGVWVAWGLRQVEKEQSFPAVELSHAAASADAEQLYRLAARSCPAASHPT